LWWREAGHPATRPAQATGVAGGSCRGRRGSCRAALRERGERAAGCSRLRQPDPALDNCWPADWC
jgi:hypothetical protein